MRTLCIALGATLCWLSWTSAAMADSYYVEHATGSGVSESDLDSATALVKTAVSDIGPNTVVEQQGDADYILQPNIIRLGAAYVLGLAKLSRDGNEIFSSQLKAQKIDELDKVATRLTRSVIIGERASSGQRVGEITDQESKDGTQRRPVRKNWYLGFGGSEFSNMNVSGIGYSLGLAYSWDVNTARIKIMAEGSGLDSAFMLSAGLGGNLYLTTADIAPYLSADFGFGAAKAEGASGFFSGDTIGGFVVGGGGGVEFLRTSSINLDLGFRAGFLLHSNTYGYPTVYSLRLGLYF